MQFSLATSSFHEYNTVFTSDTAFVVQSSKLLDLTLLLGEQGRAFTSLKILLGIFPTCSHFW